LEAILNNKFTIFSLFATILAGCSAQPQAYRPTYTTPAQQTPRWEYQQVDGPPPNNILSFNLSGQKFTIGVNGCMIVGAVVENNTGSNSNYVYTSIMAVRKTDKMTLGTGEINFPPTIAGGKSKAGHINGLRAPGMGSECSKADFILRLN
jgi:hypothetical protein